MFFYEEIKTKNKATVSLLSHKLTYQMSSHLQKLSHHNYITYIVEMLTVNLPCTISCDGK